MQLEKMIENFLHDQKLEGKADGTIEEYQHRLAVFAEFLNQNNIELDKLTKADVKDFIRQKIEKGNKITTVRNFLSTIRRFLLYSVDQSYIIECVVSTKDYPKETHTPRIKRLSDEELNILYSYLDTLQENARAAFYLMIGSGCRVGEAASLRAEDVTLRGKSVFIDIKDAKWGSDRCIPIIDKKAAEIVWKYRQDVEIDSRPLFRLSKRTLQGYATQFAKKTGITFRCHLLRHTFAGKMSEQGVPLTTIQFLLGHKSLGMTAHYAQSALVDLSAITPEVEL